jgi:hypothetical protein
LLAAEAVTKRCSGLADLRQHRARIAYQFKTGADSELKFDRGGSVA